MAEDMNRYFGRGTARDTVRLGSAGLGLALVLLGLMFLFGQIVGPIFNIEFSAVLWPFFILVPGVVILAGGLLIGGPVAEPLSIVGGMAMLPAG